MSLWSINPERLLNRIRELGEIGRDHDGRLIRLAASDTEKLGRDRPSIGGISHNPRECTHEADLVAGANVLLDVVIHLAGTA